MKLTDKNTSQNFFAFIWHAFFLSLAETFSDKNTVLPGLILLAGGSSNDIGILTSITIGAPLAAQLFFAGLITPRRYKKPYLLGGIYLRVFAFLGVAFSINLLNYNNASSLINLIFFWILLFSVSGAFAGVSYNDIIGKSFTGTVRKKFFINKQVVAAFGVLISAVLVKNLLSNFEYPFDYQLSFTLAGIILAIASIGFLFIKEKESIIDEKFSNALLVFKSIPKEIKNSKNLSYFIIISNLLGLTLTLTPFYLAFIKKESSLTNDDIGTFLLIQIIGMIISNFIWNKILHKYSFKGMLKIVIILFSLIPVSIFLFNDSSQLFFKVLFFITGAALSAYKVTMDGVLMEISDESNRSLYSGILGTFNITTAIFPLITSQLIELFGFIHIFLVLGLISFTGLFLIKKLDCPIDINN